MQKPFMILPIAMILCFMVDYQEKEAMAELEAMKAQAKVEEQNKELVRKVMDSWNNKNFEFIMEINAPDYSIARSVPIKLTFLLDALAYEFRFRNHQLGHLIQPPLQI